MRDDKEQCVIIGLPDASIKESKERILNSLHALDRDIDMKRIKIHLSPADVKKQGMSYDAAMLLAVLQAMNKKPVKIPEKTCFIAGLTLDGQLTTFHSMIPTIHQAILLGFKRIYIPPIEISLLARAANVELIRMPDMGTRQPALQHLLCETLRPRRADLPKALLRQRSRLAPRPSHHQQLHPPQPHPDERADGGTARAILVQFVSFVLERHPPRSVASRPGAAAWLAAGAIREK